MSLLVLQLPSRQRLLAKGPVVAPQASLGAATEWSYAFSSDGRSLASQGRAAASLLPRADQVVLVLGEADVSWHRVLVPRAPPARLRAALLGVMEEALLEDDEALHFALAAGSVAGQPGWVAVTHRAWLAAALAALEQAGLNVERAVAPSEPGPVARGHFFVGDPASEDAPWLALADADRAVCLPLAGGLARALLPAEPASVRWSAVPAASAAAERWLGAPVPLLGEAEHLLQAGPQGSNLRQFELAPRRRGTRALAEFGKRLLSTEWRPVRYGLTALLVFNLVGLNAYAWHQRQAIDARRDAMTELLKTSFTGVRSVLDAPLQMQRETERLRAAAGRPGDDDLETLLAAAAMAWPDGLAPVQTLRFEAGRLSLAAGTWAEPQVTQFRQRLRPLGFEADFAEGQATVRRAGVAP